MILGQRIRLRPVEKDDLPRYGDTQIKDAPCGLAGGKRGTHIYTYEPGQTITVSLVEYVPHPSYFRIAFQVNGDDEFREPATILPIDPNRKCPDGPGDLASGSTLVRLIMTGRAVGNNGLAPGTRPRRAVRPGSRG